MPRPKPILWSKVRKWRVGTHRWNKTPHLFTQEAANYWRTRCGIRLRETHKEFRHYSFVEWDGVLRSGLCALCQKLYRTDQEEVCGYEWDGRYSADHTHRCDAVHYSPNPRRHNCWCGTQTEVKPRDA